MSLLHWNLFALVSAHPWGGCLYVSACPGRGTQITSQTLTLECLVLYKRLILTTADYPVWQEWAAARQLKALTEERPASPGAHRRPLDPRHICSLGVQPAGLLAEFGLATPP